MTDHPLVWIDDEFCLDVDLPGVVVKDFAVGERYSEIILANHNPD